MTRDFSPTARNDKRKNMIYDPDANIISWEVAKGKINHAREFGNFIIHLSSTGKPILIEILEASKFIGQFDKIIPEMQKNLKQAGEAMLN